MKKTLSIDSLSGTWEAITWFAIWLFAALAISSASITFFWTVLWGILVALIYGFAEFKYSIMPREKLAGKFWWEAAAIAFAIVCAYVSVVARATEPDFSSALLAFAMIRILYFLLAQILLRKVPKV